MAAITPLDPVFVTAACLLLIIGGAVLGLLAEHARGSYWQRRAEGAERNLRTARRARPRPAIRPRTTDTADTAVMPAIRPLPPAPPRRPVELNGSDDVLVDSVQPAGTTGHKPTYDGSLRSVCGTQTRWRISSFHLATISGRLCPTCWPPHPSPTRTITAGPHPHGPHARAL